MRKLLLTAAACIMFAVPAMADDLQCATGTYNFKGVCSRPTPEQGLEMLLKGNASFVKGDLSLLQKYSGISDRKEVALGQKPFAVVLTCSDSRVPPEILFNKGLGEVFVIRVAGNVVAPHELGSIEYALEHLGSNLVVVLGHERCGAVSATYSAYPAHVEGNIGSLTESIYPAVDTVVAGTKPADAVEQAAQIEECIVENINLVSESLEAKSPIIKELVEKGETKIVRAKYDLDSGKVTVLP
ncbi:MAG: carbonic anhydrase [Desulfuromonadaceae bacterium]|nr:carbonic anhydrase [Desulfuromonadaceae bacterium]